jgi:hypothetical protein
MTLWILLNSTTTTVSFMLTCNNATQKKMYYSTVITLFLHTHTCTHILALSRSLSLSLTQYMTHVQEVLVKRRGYFPEHYNTEQNSVLC